MDDKQLQQALQNYHSWVNEPRLSSELIAELQEIQNDEQAIFERFYRDLEFGTGGLRGILGAGTNRMNLYTVRRVTRGIANYLLAHYGKEVLATRGVAIGYDCRRMSTTFAIDVGTVFAAAGIRAHVFHHLAPTPELSFAVRHLGAVAGVMITASHNPAEYNGYKVYGADGGQVLPDVAERMLTEVEAIEDIFAVPTLPQNEAMRAGLFQFIGEAADDLDEIYCNCVLESLTIPAVTAQMRANLTVVYTPLHGTGFRPVQRVLEQAGYPALHIVPEQAGPDGEFPTVQSPNPEEPEAFKLALQLAREVAGDIALGTDPDGDRVGLAVRDKDGSYTLLSGNQTGGLLLEFLLSTGQAAQSLPANGIVFKTIVTSELGAAIARRYGLAVEDTLTGFKYIGERIGHYEETGTHQFVFGYEESYGYLIKPFVRDKDAVQSCLLAAEMAAFAKANGETLLDVLQCLYEREGFFLEKMLSRTLPGADGVTKIERIMNQLRTSGITVAGLKLQAAEDYMSRQRHYFGGEKQKTEAISLPQSDVLKYIFSDSSWLAIRPSGTEPKIKVYLGARGQTREACEDILNNMETAIHEILQ